MPARGWRFNCASSDRPWSRRACVATRFGVGIPYTLNGREGQTPDLNATGVSFESDTAYPIGAIVDLTLRYGLDGHNFPLQCQVEVKRVKREGQRFCVGARMCHPFTEPED